ncbi:hypothetical protein ABFS82_05G047400 [Erythranthe guttata]|uniref:Two-component response regulator n=1 Tax=Erythranthe guttata TaxID=4155 RepID=A0A022QS77_ERYGU|nr:PREDICTED: two-component response regulator ARR2 [Erythranthe guttata]XP_012846162.1 PREDICTED: two-component response regulator ARR2 [Erythranthe guttata]XP_012846163.1 PREDICTED: two-component response regulator ARR2 [Erythranthe guttata]EYU30138.1 hypothetical protein MIMGU_mgv1a003601mg [Erythranthe guttata]EYU30139.1 hypothetical protein MIMGU_mgv1a003601mg [Erythranthe guttata]|eukprot:XP_012846161.1 PREDICTED: two-component response regulator ARR2 [Erythranthe guttata]
MACTTGGKSVVPEQFPVGLRVLVVDDDVICLRVLEQMLRKCMYQVTSCSQATVALNLLRERKGCFDVVLSDVHMPDMDGFRLLELVGLEMDLPVIMMSADGRTNLVMRGIRHGACDYLIKPIRDEELKNIWQHVLRKRRNEINPSGSIEDRDREKRAIDDAECASSANEGEDEVFKTQKKRRECRDEDDTELEDDPASKKPRVVWSVELHQQFVGAVNQLGIDKAVPKRILELMNVPGLSRENVASHLQKFRLYLKRLSGVAQQQGGLPTYCGPVEQNLRLASLGRFDIQALAASGQLPPQTLAALQAELFSRPTGNLILPAMDQRTLLHSSLQESKNSHVDKNVSYCQPLNRCSSNIANQTSQHLMSNEDVNYSVSSCNLVETNSNTLITFLQQQHQQRQSITQESIHSINVQPSCLVSPPNFQAGNNQNCSFSYSAMDYNNPLLQTSNSSGLQVLERECKPVGTPSESVSSMSSCSRNVQRVPSSPSTISSVLQVPNMNCMQRSTRNSIPSRFAVDEQEIAAMSSTSQVRLYVQNNGSKVKQEPNLGFAENVRMGIPVQQHLPPNDLMSVFSD